MNERVQEMLSGIDFGGSLSDSLDQVCVACSTAFDMAGAGVALIVVGEHRGTLSATDDIVGVVEDLQYTLGEGPCLDAHHTGLAVEEPDLRVSQRWPSYAPAAMQAGVRAVFAFPLQLGGTRVGALDLYRRAPGSMTTVDVVDAALVADVVTSLVLEMQLDVPGGPLAELVDRRAAVNQAAGMVSAQLDLPIADAYVVLRARAFADGRPIGEVAADVVARRVRFDG